MRQDAHHNTFLMESDHDPHQDALIDIAPDDLVHLIHDDAFVETEFRSPEGPYRR